MGRGCLQVERSHIHVDILEVFPVSSPFIIQLFHLDDERNHPKPSDSLKAERSVPIIKWAGISYTHTGQRS